MVTYPAGIYAPRTKANKPGVVYDAAKTTQLFAEDVANDDAEIVAVETELGTNPKGSHDSVKDRFDDDEVLISAKPDNFLELSDAPSSYAYQAGKVVKVNATEDALEFGEGGGGGLSYLLSSLSGVSFPRVFGSNLSTGNNNIYTVPAGKRALFYVGRSYNASAGNITYYIEINVSGSYYKVSDSATIGTLAGSNIALGDFIILEPGEILAVNSATNNGLNVCMECILFDSANALKTVKVLGLSNGDNTIYTCPVGKTALLGKYSLLTGGTLAIRNNSGGSRNYSIYAVPSGGSSGSSNLIFPAAALADDSHGNRQVNVSFSAGDFLVLNTNSGAATQIAWITVVEI